MRLIDADALIKRWSDEHGGAYFLPSEIIKSIEEQPTAEVVEVVRCRDCKKWEQNKNLPHGNCSYHLSLAYATDWCSWAERSNDG